MMIITELVALITYLCGALYFLFFLDPTPFETLVICGILIIGSLFVSELYGVSRGVDIEEED